VRDASVTVTTIITNNANAFVLLIIVLQQGRARAWTAPARSF
jgi:hypothetical protein